MGTSTGRWGQGGLVLVCDIRSATYSDEQLAAMIAELEERLAAPHGRARCQGYRTHSPGFTGAQAAKRNTIYEEADAAVAPTTARYKRAKRKVAGIGDSATD